MTSVNTSFEGRLDALNDESVDDAGVVVLRVTGAQMLHIVSKAFIQPQTMNSKKINYDETKFVRIKKIREIESDETQTDNIRQK
jgi:hypothetical protein